MVETSNGYPVSLSVDYPEKLNKLTTFFPDFHGNSNYYHPELTCRWLKPRGWRWWVELPVCRCWSCCSAPRINAALPAKVS